MDLTVTCSGGDRNRNFDVLANGRLLATEHLDGSRRGGFFEQRYAIPADALATATNGCVTIKFAAPAGLAGGVFDVRLMKSDSHPDASLPGTPITR